MRTFCYNDYIMCSLVLSGIGHLAAGGKERLGGTSTSGAQAQGCG